MSPSSDHKPLRQLAAEKLHGEGANPSQLGDPISLKAETSDYDARGEGADGQSSSPDEMPIPVRTPPESSDGSHEEKKLRGGHHVRGMLTDEIRQGNAPKPKKTLEGDATSMKAETVDRDPVDHENGSNGNGGGGAGRARGSKI
ncbi:hypothetical protein B0H63DRAFT_514614 [Podospora didyma]|uniref:Uncharacterized protein n=1 Tax=Podospora didyma TaxID=330526 RepID=A0AAE0N534_9PEZI|nr:hypothetical protein B0H63DRAFT_514614 [Podospora didyma]